MTAPKLDPTEARNPERLYAHYLVERELADRLRRASREERATLYGMVYDELFQKVPDHPQLTRRRDGSAVQSAIAPQLRLLERFLKPETVFLEVGAGDCRLSLAVAARVRKVYAVDVSAQIAQFGDAPPGFELIISDGTSIPAPGGSVELVYSNQLMEHLHPEDAHDQLRAIHAALAPGGRYICITPNALSGPHDISKYFDDSATGFHLREYTAAELAKIFRRVGFTRVQALHGARGRFVLGPVWPLIWLERALAGLPARVRRACGRNVLIRALLGIQLVGVK